MEAARGTGCDWRNERRSRKEAQERMLNRRLRKKEQYRLVLLQHYEWYPV